MEYGRFKCQKETRGKKQEECDEECGTWDVVSLSL
jgi:hypothetical protein